MSDVSPTWDLAGNAYFRRYSNQYIDGNDGDFENCSTRSSFRGRLCFEDDGFSRPPASLSSTSATSSRSSGAASTRPAFRIRVACPTAPST